VHVLVQLGFGFCAHVESEVDAVFLFGGDLGQAGGL
jgi:hypothetical protein